MALIISLSDIGIYGCGGYCLFNLLLSIMCVIFVADNVIPGVNLLSKTNSPPRIALIFTISALLLLRFQY